MTKNVTKLFSSHFTIKQHTYLTTIQQRR